MFNPFISIDEQLKNIGYIKQHEGEHGFAYAKHVGGGYIYIAEALKPPDKNIELTIRFYDPDRYGESALVTEKELLLFSKKLKEWKGQYESKNNN